MKKAGRTLLLALGLAILIPAARHILARTPKNAAPASLPPGIAIRAEATPKTAWVGDPIRIYIDLSMPEGYHIDAPPIGNQVGEFTILRFNPGATTAEAPAAQPPQSLARPPAKRLHHRMHMVAAVYKTGAFTFPPVAISLRTATGDTLSIASNPIAIEIRSILPKNPGLRDLKNQAEIPQPTRWGVWIGLALALAILLFLIRLIRRRASTPPAAAPQENPQDPLELAAEELRALLARGRPLPGKEKPFYVQLSDVVKKILGAAYAISTAEETTDEIRHSLQNRPGLDSKDLELIVAFLTRCDLVKFARYVPSAAEQETAMKDAEQILKQARRG